MLTIKNLLEKGVNIHAQDHSHGTSSALQLAARHGKEDAVRLLLFEGADVHAKDGDGATALHRAAISGREQIIRMLLDYGADILIPLRDM